MTGSDFIHPGPGDLLPTLIFNLVPSSISVLLPQVVSLSLVSLINSCSILLTVFFVWF